ncbi:glycosyltransferase [Bifidobacterium simiarum]|uniref:Glycosyl transferase n=1 Tax=Bifidobacterium simiarum TaxID=2045441 RepID=A0A2M9HGZ9_9BIFI|nr:glycosyltransferase [Bifidobacterium simiarum]PJM76098.1 glycosyl transferase [Bifidobacterium simiarum]
MLQVIENRNYHAVIDSVETKTVDGVTSTIIKGWAVDAVRNDTLKVSISEEGTVGRVPRADLKTIHSLKDGVNAGFQITVPGSVNVVHMHFDSPGGRVTKTLNIRNTELKLLLTYRYLQFRHLLHYISHAWTPKGMKALIKAVRRRFTKQQSFYEGWISNHETMTREQASEIAAGFSRKPLISIVTPVYNVDERWLTAFVRSVQNQWYDNWELCLADDHSPAPHIRPLLERLAAEDKRIKVVFRKENGQISRATNSAIELASGDYVGFMDNDDELAPQALFEVVRTLNENPDVDFIYTDEDKVTEEGIRFDPFFKPGWSPNLLLGHNYITHFVVVSRDLLDRVGPLRSDYDGSQDYDFVLRATEQAKAVHHIPQMLYHWRTLASSVAGDPRSKMYAYEAGQKAIEAALERRGIDAEVTMLDNLGTYKVDYRSEDPAVTVIASSYTDEQFDRLRGTTSYPSVEFVRVKGDEIHQAADQASGDYLVFLDAVMPQSASWLSEMVNYTHGPNVGIVGGKIFDHHKRVVNVGVTLRALKSGEPFEMRGEWDEGIGYYFRDLLPREMFAVTEECLLISHKDYEQLKGFNTGLKPGLRGIDLSMRLTRTNGKSVLWQPYSTFTDLKKTPLTLAPADVNAYLKNRQQLTDRFSSACFPESGSKQDGIVYSIDTVEWTSNGRQLKITGWATDLHDSEDVEISLGSCPGVRLDECTRSLRADVNLSLPVPANSLLGFTLLVGVPGGRQSMRTNSVPMVLNTSTDQRIVKVPVERSKFREDLKKFIRKVKLLRHPRSTGKRLIEKYWAPRWQKQAYQRLIAKTEHYDPTQVQAEIAGFKYRPLISIVTPVYNVDEQWLRKCVQSIRNQYYDNWELCLADDHSSKPHVRPLMERLAAEDKRIKVVFREENGHISRATNSALEIATGEFVGLMDNDDELPPQALYEVVRALNADPKLDLIYTDEDKIDEEGHRSDPHFKPDYAPDLLMSTNYISHFGVYRRSIVEEIGGLRVGYEGSQDYDLTLRFVEKTTPEHIHHIPKVLYHWRTLATSTASSGSAKSYTSDAGLRALESAIERRGIDATVQSAGPNGIYNVHYAIKGQPLVSVVIPTKNGYDNVERCVSSIIKKTTYPNYEIVLADNGSTNPHMFELYKRFEEELGDRFRVEEIDIPFNFSRINNLAAKTAKGEYLLFLNDDTEVIAPDWMTRMLSFAQLDRVGVVGAKLYYPTETIQHAGIVLGLGGAAGHIQVGFPRGYLGYFGRLIENVNYYAVTAACCMVKADDFWAVDGFDEKLAVAYNDVDLCIRIHDRLGRDNVWAHEAELYHYESVTRGYDVKSREKKARLDRESAKFREKYGAIVENDPYYNPNLSRTSGNFWVRKV